jgi:hypothetical protein
VFERERERETERVKERERERERTGGRETESQRMCVYAYHRGDVYLWMNTT